MYMLMLLWAYVLDVMLRSHRKLHTKKKRTLIIKEASRPMLVDRLTFIAAIVEPIMTIPQAWDIFRLHNAVGISLTTWTCYLLLGSVWIWWSLVHKQHIVLLYELLYVVLEVTIISGGIMYGAKW